MADDETKEAARRVLKALMSGDFDSRIKGASAGLRWLREMDFLSEKQWKDRPVLLNAQGRNLAKIWGISPTSSAQDL